MPPKRTRATEEAAPLTVVAHYGMQKSSCGYCKSKTGNHTFMMRGGDTSILGMTVRDYKDLLDRGWRRSGSLLYKPDLRNSCCQQYTIRLDANKFKPSKDQRQTLNRWSSYVLGQDYIYKSSRQFPITRLEKKTLRTTYSLPLRIHAPELSTLLPKTSPDKKIYPKHELLVTLEENTFTQEKFELYSRYQVAIHGDKPGSLTESGFTRFLCTNPFKPPYSTSATGQKYGAYHQCYRLNGVLVALSVIDLLPGCVSGVYFIYDDSIKDFSPGKLSALRETSLAAEEGYDWYYMGFYIHNCKKMLYKGTFSPSFILDGEDYGWVELDKDLKKKLDDGPYLGRGREGERSTYIKPANNAMKEEEEEEYDDDEEEDFSGTVFTNKMSGTPTVLQLEETMDLGKMKIALGGRMALAEYLVGWEDMGIEDEESIKCMLSEIAATVGTELAGRIVVQLTRRYFH